MSARKKHSSGGMIYQINLRMFTPEGTLKSAETLLPHVKAAGAEFVYLTPVAELDPDSRREYWSERQKKSGAENPKNQYRIRDYFAIDPEVGRAEDLHSFIRTAHGLGLKVMLDLVYLHCGPSNVLIRDIPGAVTLTENGEPKVGPWSFPLLNHACPELRKYLWRNMVQYVRDFDADALRMDVGFKIPLDFWEEGMKKVRAVKKEVFALNEGDGEKAEFRRAFDCAYDFKFEYTLLQVMKRAWNSAVGEPVSNLVDILEKAWERVGGYGRTIRMFTNHDIATDEPWLNDVPEAIKETALVLCFTLDGHPLVYNGVEIADHNKHNMFYPAGHGWGVDWSRALTAEGERRMGLMQKLCALRQTWPELADGDFRLLKADEWTLQFVRSEKVVVTLNFGVAPVKCKNYGDQTVLAHEGVRVSKTGLTLAPCSWYIQTMKRKA